MDPFSILPAEIIVSILEACTDFASLDSLLRASARADRVFGNYYQTITERIGKNCPILSQGLQFAFYDIILLESDKKFTPSSLPELLPDARPTPEVPLSLPPGCSLGAVRKAIATAASIYRAAFACISVLLERFLAAKPRRVVNDDRQPYEWIRGGSSEPQSKPIRIKYHPPSWAEIYRTHRILWTLATFDCILCAASTRWNWSLEDKNSFTEQYAENQWPYWRLEELKTIVECLSDICPSETTTLDDHLPFLVTLSPPENVPLTAPALSLIPIHPRNPAEDKDWESIQWQAGGSNDAVARYRFIFRTQRLVWNHPLRYVNFEVFRRLGLPIWDKWRLHLMGLVPRPRDQLCPDSSVFDDLPMEWLQGRVPGLLFTWWSLAEKKDINEKVVPMPDWIGL